MLTEWQTKLATISWSLETWINVQRNWMYLQSIFNAADIQRQLPTEAKLFHQVDKNYLSTQKLIHLLTILELMKKTSVAPNILYIVIKEGVSEVLTQATKNIEVIIKGLENYLEMKRLAFPRFYFLSNDELLNILAHIREPTAVQPYLSKCFESILFIFNYYNFL